MWSYTGENKPLWQIFTERNAEVFLEQQMVYRWHETSCGGHIIPR